VEDRKVFVSHEEREEFEHEIPTTLRLLVKEGDQVTEGEPLTEGSLNPHRVLRVQGREAAQMYLLNEIQKVYRSQGQNIHDKHFEVIIRKMMSKVQVFRPGDVRVTCLAMPWNGWKSKRSTSNCWLKGKSRPNFTNCCWV